MRRGFVRSTSGRRRSSICGRISCCGSNNGRSRRRAIPRKIKRGLRLLVSVQTRGRSVICDSKMNERRNMSVGPTIPGIESLTLMITQEIHVNASLETTFESLLEQLGPENETPEQKMPMKVEPWPGGRWFRDLGDGNGHFWGHVQAIKRPTLLEITGPLFMSYGVVSNL